MTDHAELIDSTDAKRWAREFIALFGTRLDEVDEGLMLSWFANAIETGRRVGDAALAAETERADGLDLALQALRVDVAAEAREDALREALERIAAREDVDVNGEYVSHNQPVLSAARANVVAREALARTAGEQP
jgi:hypothetical protein